MKSYRKELWFDVPSRRAFINITPEIETALRESGIREGFYGEFDGRRKKRVLVKVIGE